MRGTPLQTREAAEAAQGSIEDEEAGRVALESAWDKIDGAIAAAGIGSGSRSTKIRFSIYELRMLRQFRRQYA